MIPTPTLLLLAAAPRVWPVNLEPSEEPAEVENQDLNQDGVLDERVRVSSGGTGWSESTVCVADGASGHIACEQWQSTTYALFSGQRRTLAPSVDNRAEPMLGQDDCRPADPKDPAQGMMWALRAPIPSEGPVTPAGPWMPGRPVDQASACLSIAEAEALPSGMSWYASGEDPEGMAAAGWRVQYSAARSSSPFEPQPAYTPRRVGSLGALEIDQLGHALAVYDSAKNRHAWLINLEGVQGEAFKFTRWESVEAVKSVGPHTLRLQVPRELHFDDHGEPTPLIVELGPLLATP